MQYLISTKRNDGDIITRSTAKIQADYYFNRKPNKKYDKLYQGVFKLPKEDKYEEFKKWFRKNCKNEVNLDWLNDVFIDFEKELEEKEKEETIKKIIFDAFENNMVIQRIVDEIYTELEKGGYLK